MIDCTGKYLIPGLVDGFAGMNTQGQANANLYMGVTTVVARSDDRARAHRFCRQSQPPSLLDGFDRDHRQLEPSRQSARSGPPSSGRARTRWN